MPSTPTSPPTLSQPQWFVRGTPDRRSPLTATSASPSPIPQMSVSNPMCLLYLVPTWRFRAGWCTVAVNAGEGFFTLMTSEPLWTVTPVLGWEICSTRAVIQTWLFPATTVFGTIVALVVRSADTSSSLFPVHTRTTVMTKLVALADVTIQSCNPRRARACVLIHSIDTCRSLRAPIPNTIINVDVTICPRPSHYTGAHVTADDVPTLLVGTTGVTQALIDIRLTLISSKALYAVAQVATSGIDASATIPARLLVAWQQGHITQPTGVSRGALTDVRNVRRGGI